MTEPIADRDETPRLVGVSLGDEPAAWSTLGFAVDDDTVDLGALSVHCRGDGGPPALELDRAHPAGDDSFLGVPWHVVVPGPPSAAAPAHPNGVGAIDHVVITATDAPSVREALAGAGIAIRRERAARLGETEIVQLFAFAGDVLLELVAPEHGEAAAGPPAGLWGLAVTAPDLDATVDRLGDRCGPATDAVQRGRRIATARSAEAGCSLRLAIMSPRV